LEKISKKHEFARHGEPQDKQLPTLRLSIESKSDLKMSMTSFSPKLRPLVQRAAKSQGARAMTVLSKESGEEYKKLVRIPSVVFRRKFSLSLSLWNLALMLLSLRLIFHHRTTQLAKRTVAVLLARTSPFTPFPWPPFPVL
jgi:hypothetical protein